MSPPGQLGVTYHATFVFPPAWLHQSGCQRWMLLYAVCQSRTECMFWSKDLPALNLRSCQDLARTLDSEDSRVSEHGKGVTAYWFAV